MTKIVPYPIPYWMHPALSDTIVSYDAMGVAKAFILSWILCDLDICSIDGDMDFKGDFTIWVDL